MTESKIKCDMCGKILPKYEKPSTFTVPYQIMEIWYHPGPKYSADLCDDCAYKIAKMMDDNRTSDMTAEEKTKEIKEQIHFSVDNFIPWDDIDKNKFEFNTWDDTDYKTDEYGQMVISESGQTVANGKKHGRIMIVW